MLVITIEAITIGIVIAVMMNVKDVAKKIYTQMLINTFRTGCN